MAPSHSWKGIPKDDRQEAPASVTTGMTWLDSSEVRGKYQPENELTKSLAGAIFRDGNNDASGGSRLLTRWINAALALKFIS